MTKLIQLETKDGIGIIRIDRPPVNALCAALMDELGEVSREAAAQQDVHAVVVHGGERVFAAGADIDELKHLSASEVLAYARQCTEGSQELAAIPKPVIAAVNGYALGGGLELALCADFRVCGESAKLGLPEVMLGVIPGGGGTQRLPRLIGQGRAKDLIFTGRTIDAQEAQSIGLVDSVVPDDRTLESAISMAAQFVGGPRLAIAAAKRAVDTGANVDLGTALEIERLQFAALFATEDREIGMRSFMEHGPGKAKFVGR